MRIRETRGSLPARRARFLALDAIAAAALAALIVPPPSAAYEVSVRDVHVTQGMQTVRWEAGNTHGFAAQEGNTIPLVARRSTTVRVLLDLQVAQGEEVPAFTGRLRTSINGSPVYAAPRPASNEPFLPPASPDIQSDGDTLNFDIVSAAAGLLAPPAGQNESNDVDFHVGIVGPTGEVEATGDAEDMTIVRMPRTTFLGVPVSYPPAAEQPPPDGIPIDPDPDPAIMAEGVADAFLAAAWPVEDTCFPPPDCSQIVSGPAQLVNTYQLRPGIEATSDPGRGAVPALEQLSAYWVTTLFLRQDDPTHFVYGFVSDDILLGGSTLPRMVGATSPATNVGIGTDRASKAQRTFAHEVGHMHQLVNLPAGVSHHPCPEAQLGRCVTLSPDVGWDVLGRLVGNPAANQVVARAKTFEKRDIMNRGGGGPFANDSWPNADSYRQFLEEHRRRNPTASGARAGSRTRSARARRACNKTLSITGRVRGFAVRPGAARGSATRARDLKPRRARINPVFSFDECLTDPPKVAGREAELVAKVTTRYRGKLRRVRWPIDARYVIDYEIPFGEGNGTRLEEKVKLGPFAIAVPVKGRVLSVRLKKKRGGRILTRLRRSRVAPRINIRGIEQGSTLSDEMTLRWRTRDRDTLRKRIDYRVLYSADGGKNFSPIAVNQSDRRLAIDPDRLPASEGKGVLRVLASDGLITRTKQVRRLTNPVAG